MKNINLSATARTHQWWKPKASSLLNILYLAMLAGSLPFSSAALLFAPAILTVLGIGSFGHFVNDWCDAEADRLAGKQNRLAGLPAPQKWLIVFGALTLALLPWLVLPSDWFSWLLLGAEFSLLLLYAVPPVRIKGRRVLAIPTDGAYAYAVPAVLAAHTFFLAAGGLYDRLFLIALFFWQLSLGVRHFLNHLALDRINDLASRAPTLATVKGNYYLHRLIRNVILPLELLSFGAFLLNFSRYSLPLVIACTVSLLALCGFQLVLTLARRHWSMPYSFSHILLDDFYQNVLPLISLLFLIYEDARFTLLLAAHLLLLYGAPLVRAFVGGAFLVWRRLFAGGRGQPPSLSRDPRAAAEETHAARALRDRSRPNIAVANINRSKYTETFINELVPRLNYNTYYLHGGELPIYDDDGRHFLSGRLELHVLSVWLETFLRLRAGHFLRHSLGGYLQAKSVRLVLAEFGPVGAQLLPITRDLGIPLVVYFHGYDVFHQPTWNANLPTYRELFKEAERILVVSALMGERLRQSGAPPGKIVHLPAFVNLELFPYRDRSSLPPRFIAVGRFAETKSPHLTILAFRQVVEAVPEATLVMLGKGGGGELFEACLILCKALGLEDKITFKGAVSHREVAEEMAHARALVQHSVTTPEHQDMEGKPVAVMEAMSSGLPVVATRHSGIAELITDETDGLLVEEYDVDATARAMIRLARNDALVKTLGEKASGRIRNDALIRDHISTLESIIDECIGPPR